MHAPTSLWDWCVFVGIVLGILILDRALFGRSKKAISFREASVRSTLFVLVGILFSLYVLARKGGDGAVTYVVAYLVEESLSVDNLFVFLVLFNYFRVNDVQQQRVLFWGIVGAVVMRGIFIVAGAALLSRFHFMTYVFGGFLVVTGLRLLFRKEDAVSPEDNLALRLARRHLRTTPEFHGDRFFTVVNGVRRATPLLLVVTVVEMTDLVFAIDSVPAVLSVSNDIYIVYTSNVMAILGLRALYFVLSGMMGRFRYLGTGLALILLFIGVKMSLTALIHVPSLVSLVVITLVLVLSVGASVLRSSRPSRPSSQV